MLVLDSGAVTWFASQSGTRNRVFLELVAEFGPALVPVEVVVECTTGRPSDAPVNRFLKNCEIVEMLPVALARLAAARRFAARRGSAVDAIVAVSADGGAVVTGDVKDISALVHEHTTVIAV